MPNAESADATTILKDMVLLRFALLMNANLGVHDARKNARPGNWTLPNCQQSMPCRDDAAPAPGIATPRGGRSELRRQRLDASRPFLFEELCRHVLVARSG